MSGNEQTRSNGNGIPDDLRCKRSDGKQWRCTAMSMPDKTVCEKHYVQAKKRAANSAFRAANQKKVKRRGETDTYSDGFDIPIHNNDMEQHYSNGLGLRLGLGLSLASASKNDTRYASPEIHRMRNYTSRVAVDLNDEFVGEDGMFEDSYRSYRTQQQQQPMDMTRNRLNQSMSPMEEYSAASTESLGQICHQCQSKDSERIVTCLKCNQRAFCDTCVSTLYSEISLEELEKVCPACRGLCDCKLCLRSDNTIKVRIREIPVLDKLRYLYRLLSSVLPVIKQIHNDQCIEVELEKKLRGAEIDLVRARLKADEQMCCNVCRVPVVDYYRHCSNCSYDLCLRCCQDLRVEITDRVGKLKLNFSSKFPEWEANSDGSIPCPPKEYGGCGSRSLNLARIFKMNWVAKVVKNAEEMVNGCKVYNLRNPESGDEDFVIKSDDATNFEKQWEDGGLVIVKNVLDEPSSSSRWDPESIRKDIDEVSDEKLLKVVNCVDGLQVDVRFGEIMKAYRDGRNGETDLPLLWKLKDWPSPSASEEFVFYQRPEFVRRFPFLEYIHPRIGLLNVSAKLPHYSLHNDVGPKIYVSCGTYKENSGGGNSIHYSMRDMVYLMVHTSEETKPERMKETNSGLGKPSEKMDEDEPRLSTEEKRKDLELNDLSLGSVNIDKSEAEIVLTVNPENNTNDGEYTEPSGLGEPSEKMDEDELSRAGGAQWDIFRRQDVPKLAEYLQRTFQKPDSFNTDFVSRPLYDGLFLKEDHKRELKDEFGVEPWTFELHRGEAIFIPAGCPFQVRNLQSNVQVALDFLRPESVGESAKLAEEIRCLPNDHEAKLQILEIGKISLYAASSAIKEVHKLVLHPKFGAELGFEDLNLTKTVSNNLEKAMKRPQQIIST